VDSCSAIVDSKSRGGIACCCMVDVAMFATKRSLAGRGVIGGGGGEEGTIAVRPESMPCCATKRPIDAPGKRVG